MNPNNSSLPQLSGGLFLTDGGIETSLIFLDGFDLPFFASFDLLKDEKGYQALYQYYVRYLEIAKKYETGFILESPTWRASPDWIKKLGYPEGALAEFNEKAMDLMNELKNEFKEDVRDIVISGCIGPRGDGYKPEGIMTEAEAQQYHRAQIEVFSRTAADLVSALTMNYVEEAVGIVQAANAAGIPVVISFTVETNGLLPTGMSLKEAIERVDGAAQQPPAYYMVNCAHTSHFSEELDKGAQQEWTRRIKGIRANASCKSHAELDEATELDSGHPQEFGADYHKLKTAFPQLNVLGGCCGSDERHIIEIARQSAATAS